MLIGSLSCVAQALALLLCSFIGTLDGYWVGMIASLSKVPFGGQVLYEMAAYSYITDQTKSSNVSRTIRMGIFSCCNKLGSPVGMALGSLVSGMNLGYAASFSISAGIGLAGFIVVLFGVVNDSTNVQGIHCFEKLGSEKESVVHKIRNIFKGIWECISLPFKKRESFLRVEIILLLVCFICCIAPAQGFKLHTSTKI
jgi:hypothetical protein